ncbi:dTDP-glucose 4,6-dehydratase [Kribbella sp. NPDC050470]|uniref:dTDP-glucose 4,6-dehydratase n=1 Tax=unclassified Kribbella TaxID=2644121 RepID=UPI0037A0C02D
MSHLILTGASGFVGSHVLRHVLSETDWTVACPVSFRHKGLPARITARIDSAAADHPEWRDRIDIVRCDLSAPVDHMTFNRLGGDRCDFLLNVASESHVDRSISDPVGFVSNNVSLVLNVLEAARKMPNLQALIQISTDEVYGPAPDSHNHAEWEPLVPSNPYAASKAAQEAIAISYWRTYGLPLIITNTMNIIGEMQDAEKFIPMTIKRVLSGEKMTIHGSPDGRIGSRFYLHARNQADALLYLLRNAHRGPVDRVEFADGAVEALRWGPGVDRPLKFHVVGEREVDNLEMARMVAEYAGRQLAYEIVDFHSSRPGHDLRYAMDGARMEALGWKAPVPLEDSLRKTVEWTLAHPEWLA